MPKKILIPLLFFIVVSLTFIATLSPNAETPVDLPYQGSIYDQVGSTQLKYSTYRLQHPQVYPAREISIAARNYSETDNPFNDETVYEVDELDRAALYIPETVSVAWEFFVEEAGYYALKVSYLAVSGRSSEITRRLVLNGEVPFVEVATIALPRIWQDSFPVDEYRQEGRHDLKPSQVEKHRYQETFISDRVGYYHGDEYTFYLTTGWNTLALISEKEPIVVESLTFMQASPTVSYETYLQRHQTSGAIPVEMPEPLRIQGEASYEKSSPILSPTANWSSFKVQPYERFMVRYNTIGGITWRVPGDFITWQIEVPSSGLYQLTFKVSQNFSRGVVSTRRLKINGQVPFEEAKQLSFHYDNDWMNVTLGSGESPYWFYFEEGVHTITLENTLGVYNEIVQRTEETIAILNTMYRRIVMITGTTPDQYQDYLLYQRISTLRQMITTSIQNIEAAMNQMETLSGQRGAMIATFEKVLFQLRRFEKSEKNIQTGIKELGDNISALGTWVMSISQQPLSIDEFYLHSSDTPLPKPNTHFFQKLWHEVVMLFGSYGANTSLQSNVEVPGPTITVWIMSGRDQSTLLRQIIDESFSVQENVNVNLKLVSGEALLPATLSGNGPDVAIGVGQNIPVNWGIRNAVVDLTQFDDFQDVIPWFHQSAITPFQFRQSVYALPDTQDFLISFVRTDIMQELNLAVPSNWDQVLDLLPALQRQYLDFYLPNSKGTLSPLLYAMIVQRGGTLYEEDGKSTLLLEHNAQSAFLDFTYFFRDFGFAISANFANRFRSGEMPIGVFNYTLYNTLSVFAPEIKGQWEFAMIPGYEVDGTLRQQTTSISTGSIILSQSQEQEASWKFLKWWVSQEAQSAYARGMEAILGAAARYPTANLEAFASLPWSTKDYQILTKQREVAVGIPTVPGDYIIGRHIDNAFRRSINDRSNPRENLFEYVARINVELERKRQEFHLD